MCGRNRSGRVDPCIRRLVDALSGHADFTLVASCCGHGRYPITLVARDRLSGTVRELISGMPIPRTRNFYRKDSAGFYYLPEVPPQANRLRCMRGLR